MRKPDGHDGKMITGRASAHHRSKVKQITVKRRARLDVGIEDARGGMGGGAVPTDFKTC